MPLSFHLKMVVLHWSADLWRWATQNDGLYPWLENNQGLITLIALAAALYAFIAETKRANEAKAEAVLAENERRAYEQSLEERQAAERHRADQDRRLAHMASFVKTANGVILEVERAITIDKNAGLSEHGPRMIFPTARLKTQAKISAGALVAILPAAPMEPALIVEVRRVALDLEFEGARQSMLGEGGLSSVLALETRLRQAREKLTEFNIELFAQLRPEIAEAAFAAPQHPGLWPITPPPDQQHVPEAGSRL